MSIHALTGTAHRETYQRRPRELSPLQANEASWVLRSCETSVCSDATQPTHQCPAIE